MSEDSQQIAFDLTYTPRHPQAPMFDGSTISRVDDEKRLSGQMLAVYNLMRDGRWRTLAEIHAVVNGSEAGISARLRDCRKSKWGGHTVNRRRRGDAKRGCFEYQILVRSK
jgi:hypothetical protein